jgi:hypothetical protein
LRGDLGDRRLAALAHPLQDLAGELERREAREGSIVELERGARERREGACLTGRALDKAAHPRLAVAQP